MSTTNETVYLDAHLLSEHCWQVNILRDFNSYCLNATKTSLSPVMFEATLSPGGFVIGFRFMRVESLLKGKSGLFSWKRIDTCWAELDALSHQLICAALDEVLKVEAYEAIEGPRHEELHCEDVERARDHSMVFAAIGKQLVSSDSSK